MLPKQLTTGVRYTGASARNRKITIQAPNATADDLGGVSGYTTIATPWAKIVSLKGREVYKSQQITAEVSHMITIAFPKTYTVLSKMIVLYKTRKFEIVDVSDPDEGKVDLQLLCLERNDGTVGV